MSPNNVSQIHAYTPDEFANRVDVLRLVDTKMGKGIRQDTISVPAVTLFGVRGMGKTWILKHLLNKYKKTPNQKGAKQKGTLGIYLSFATLPGETDDTRHIPLIENLVAEIEARLSEDERQQYYKRDFEAMQKAISLTKEEHGNPILQKQFITLVKSLSRRYVLLLLLDKLEHLLTEPTLMRWFGDHIMDPLVRTEQVVLVLAGYKKIHFNAFPIRRRLNSLWLAPFSIKEVQEQVDKVQHAPSSPPPLPELFRFSSGHPLTTWKLIVETERSKAEILKDTEDLLLQDTNDETLCHRLHRVSVLRGFEVNALSLLLRRLESPAPPSEEHHYLLIIEDMVRSNLVFWNRDKKAYLMDPAARQIFNLRLLLTDPQTFQERHKAAHDIYVDWIDKYPGTIDFVIQAIYHTVAMALTPDGKAPESVWTALNQLLEHTFEKTSWHDSDIEKLKDQLQKDAELKMMLTDTLWQKLNRWAYESADISPEQADVAKA